ncbi:MAG: hypothetical protein IPL61_23505 [Myxococcales bacterium]|nr:hypothetical protein [Myxococcales bacterium]
MVLALAAASAILARPRACGGLAERYPPIIAFELARDGGDLAALFGPPGPCRERLVTAMDTANLVDLALFMPAYGLLLVAFFASSARASRRQVQVGVALVALALLADLLEDVCLLALTPGLDPGSPWLARLPWVTAVKWLALGATAATAATILARAGTWGRLGAGASVVALVLTIGAVALPAQFGPVVTAGVAAAWLACLAAMAARARRG